MGQVAVVVGTILAIFAFAVEDRLGRAWGSPRSRYSGAPGAGVTPSALPAVGVAGAGQPGLSSRGRDLRVANHGRMGAEPGV